MGRPKLNRTKEELDGMNRIRRNRYYENHRKEECEKNLKRYHNKKKISDGDVPLSSSINI